MYSLTSVSSSNSEYYSVDSNNLASSSGSDPNHTYYGYLSGDVS